MATARGIQQYITGSDITVYYSPTGSMFTDADELDVESMVISEEGNVTPMYDFNQLFAKHFAYSTSLITGRLTFHFTPDYVNKFRVQESIVSTPVGGTGTEANELREASETVARYRLIRKMNNGTIWLKVRTIEWWPETRIVQDILRISHVFEQPMQHEPDPSAKEVVSFIGRSLDLIERKVRVINNDSLEVDDNANTLDANGVLIPDRARVILGEEGGNYHLDGVSMFRFAQDMTLVTLTNVVDADTIDVKTAKGETFRVRMSGIDTFETAKDYLNARKNVSGDKRFAWPDGATPRDPIDRSKGYPGEAPSGVQLDAWGSYAKEKLKAKLGFTGSNSPSLYLVQDPGVGYEDKNGRRLAIVKTIQMEDVAEYLIREGLGRYSTTTSMSVDAYGNYASRYMQLKQIYDNARSIAGTNNARGIWWSFDLDLWKQHTNEN